MDGGRKEQLGQGGHLLLAVGVAGGGRREHLGQGGHLLLAVGVAGGGRREHLGQGGHLLLAVGVAGGGRREHLGQDGHLLLAPDQTRPGTSSSKYLLSSLLTLSTSSKEKSVEMEMICFYISTCLPSPSF